MAAVRAEATLLLLSSLFSASLAIICFECDAIESPRNNCPGWHRAPIDTFIDRHDKGGLFTHCVEIRLANGTVIHQGAYPESPSCGSTFKQVWRQTLEGQFKQRVRIRCCDHNMCNGPNGRAGGERTPNVALFALVLCVLRFYGYGAGGGSSDFRTSWRSLVAS